MVKVIRPGNIFFEDDVKIIDAELDTPLDLPVVPIFSRDELQILYNGHVFVASRDAPKDQLIKVYTMVFGLEEVETPKEQEDRYFADNATHLDKEKEEFIERVVNGISLLDDQDLTKDKLAPLSEELVNRIRKKYGELQMPQRQTTAGNNLVGKLDDGSVFNTEIRGYERVLFLDGKIYNLQTISEYVSIFENSFEPNFYKKLLKACESQTPEEVSQLITDNKDKVHRKVLSKVRNKIWHSDRSGKVYLDRTYWIPYYRESADNLITTYSKLLEKKVKVDAARSLK